MHTSVHRFLFLPASDPFLRFQLKESLRDESSGMCMLCLQGAEAPNAGSPQYPARQFSVARTDMGCSPGAGRPSMPPRVFGEVRLRLETVAMGCSQEAGKPSMPRRSDRRGSPSPLAGCRKSPSSCLEAQKDPFSLGLNAIGTSAWLKLAGCRRPSMPLPREALRTTPVPHSPAQKDLFFLRLRTIGTGAWLRLAGCRRPSVPLPREALKTTSAPHSPEFYVWAYPVDGASR